MADTSTILISSGIGGAISYLGAILKNQLDLRAGVDKDLRERREPLYKKMWKMTGRIALWPAKQVTYHELQQLSLDLRDWYFNDGGIYMSTATQARYQDLQKTIKSILEPPPPGTPGPPADPLKTDEYETVRATCSDLRTSMTEDLLSRRGSGRLRRILHRHQG